MAKLRYYTAMALAKAMRLALKLLGRNATYLPGKAALRLCPDFLHHLTMPETVICVTGTNGKTTVSNLITSVLTDCGCSVTSNSFGSNIQAGVATALLADATFTGKPRKQAAVLEVDERSSLLVYDGIRPDYLVCTNVMRDSIKRNAHTDFISYLLSKGIPASAKLILNADDILCAHLAPDSRQRVYFGISAEAPESCAQGQLRDIVYCPQCGGLLQPTYLRYNHIGRISCPDCGYGTPEADYCVTAIDRENGTFTVTHHGKEERFRLINDNLVNLYNLCAVIALLEELGLSYETLSASFDTLEIVKSRHETQKVGTHQLTAIMAKGQNPIAVAGVYRYVAGCPGTNKTLLIDVDDVEDNEHNSENVSWIYDTANSPALADDSIGRIVFIGKRCLDYVVHARMSGIPEERLTCVTTCREAVELINPADTGDVYVLYELYRHDEAMRLKQAVAEKLEGGTAQ